MEALFKQRRGGAKRIVVVLSLSIRLPPTGSSSLVDYVVYHFAYIVGHETPTLCWRFYYWSIEEL